MELHRARTGKRITYAELAEMTSLAPTTIESIAARPGYNTTLRTIERICAVLGCEIDELLQLVEVSEEPRRDRRGRRGAGR